MIAIKTILDDSIWAVDMGDKIVKGTFKEIRECLDSDKFRNIDLCAIQPDHLKEFYDKYFLSEEYVTIQEFYRKHFANQ